MKTFSNKQNAVRDARKTLGGEATPGADFRVFEADDGRWAWSETTRAAPIGMTAADLPAVSAALEAALQPLAEDLCVVDGRRHGNPTRAEDARQRKADKAKAAASADMPKAEPREKGQLIGKALAMVEAAKRHEGVTAEEVRELTGWTKLGGFYGAVARAGLVLHSMREVGGVRWFATDTPDHGQHMFIRREAEGPWAYFGVFDTADAALAKAPADFAADVSKSGAVILSPRSALGKAA